MNFFVKATGIAVLLAASTHQAFAQIATPDLNSIGSVEQRNNGTFNSLAIMAQPIEQLSVTGRMLTKYTGWNSKDSFWDAGTEFRAFRYERTGATVAFTDLGLVARYGSQGVKIAAESGYLFGESADLYFWSKTAFGNYRDVAAGFQIGRLSASGNYGNYFENAANLGFRFDRRGYVRAQAGWSSIFGWNADIKLNVFGPKAYR